MGLGLIRSLATQIAQAYPGRKWKPNELADTLHYGLEQMKDVDPAIRSLAVAQLNAQLKQAGLTQGQEKIDEVKVRDQNIADYRKGVLEQKKADLEGKLKIAAASQAGQDRRTAMRDAVQMQVANIREAGADQRQAAALDAKAQAQAAGLDEKEWETATRAELQREGFDNNYITRLFAADPTKPAGSIKAPVRKPLPGPPQRGGAGTTGTQRNPAKVSTPEEAAKLPPGAFFVTPDGQVRQRHG